jgi:hypothetical protein
MPRGRPKGSKNKSEPRISSDQSTVAGIESTNLTHEKDKEIKPVVSTTLPKLNEGMKWFEAPDGTLYEGPAEKNFIYKNGMTINPKR